MPAPARTSVFISYSHADERWRKLVEKHLAPLGRDHKLRIWSDRNLIEGEPWLARIKRELATAKVGILLVSADFLASDFIHSDELPPLLSAARKEGVTLLTIVVGYCHFSNSPLGRLQAFNKPDKPLEALSIPQRNKEMARLCAKLMKLFGLKAGGVKSSATTKAVVTKEKSIPRKTPKRVTPIIASPIKKEAPNTTGTGAAKSKAIAKHKAIAKNKEAKTQSTLAVKPAINTSPSGISKSNAKATAKNSPKKAILNIKK
jgi:hypothetical protein